MNNIEYYKNKKDSVIIKYLKHYDIYNEGNFNSENIKILICLLTKNNEVNSLEEVLKELFENYKYDRDYEYDKYFEYDNEFIIKLLFYYKNKIIFSKKDFELILIKEKEEKSNSIVNFNIQNKYCYYYEGYICETISPIFIACCYGMYDMVKLLLNFKANINIRNNNSDSVLHMISYNKDTKIIELLLLLNNRLNINITNKDGDTPLHIACRLRYGFYSKMISYLIHHGANINKTNKNNETPLINLCKYTFNDSYLPLLIENGADINKTDNEGDTPLIICCKSGKESFVKILIDYGADVNVTDNKGNTPLILCCTEKYRIRNIEILKSLIEKSADINKRGYYGVTALHKASEWCSKRLIRLFIDHGADVKVKTNGGIPPYKYALFSGNNEAYDILRYY